MMSRPLHQLVVLARNEQHQRSVIVMWYVCTELLPFCVCFLESKILIVQFYICITINIVYCIHNNLFTLLMVLCYQLSQCCILLVILLSDNTGLRQRTAVWHIFSQHPPSAGCAELTGQSNLLSSTVSQCHRITSAASLAAMHRRINHKVAFVTYKNNLYSIRPVSLDPWL